jgi:hypothetical protein
MSVQDVERDVLREAEKGSKWRSHGSPQSLPGHILVAAGRTRVEGNKRASNVAPTKAEAQAKGRQMAIERKTEHKIQNREGQITERNSYGSISAVTQPTRLAFVVQSDDVASGSIATHWPRPRP